MLAALCKHMEYPLYESLAAWLCQNGQCAAGGATLAPYDRCTGDVRRDARPETIATRSIVSSASAGRQLR
jgi:hypothetical protein